MRHRRGLIWLEARRLMIVLTGEDLATFSDATRREILHRLQCVVGKMPSRTPQPVPKFPDLYDDINIDHLEDITRKHIHKWMEGLSLPVHKGVRIIAERGPVVEASALFEADINVRHFQSSTTRRTRALTGDTKAYFLAWDKWRGMDDPDGRYAVSPITHLSLRHYFRLD